MELSLEGIDEMKSIPCTWFVLIRHHVATPWSDFCMNLFCHYAPFSDFWPSLMCWKEIKNKYYLYDLNYV